MFWAPCSSGEGAGERGAWGVSPHECMHMYRNCKWPPTWRHPCLTCMCVHACIHAWDTPHTNTHSYPYPPICHPLGGTPRISKNSITLELIKIFQFRLEDMNSPPMGGCIVWWVGSGQITKNLGGCIVWWVGSGQITKNLINVDPIKIIQFCLKIYDL